MLHLWLFVCRQSARNSLVPQENDQQKVLVTHELLTGGKQKKRAGSVMDVKEDANEKVSNKMSK